MITVLVLNFSVLTLLVAVNAKLCPDVQHITNVDPEKFSVGSWKEMYYNVDDPFRIDDIKCVEKRASYDTISNSLTIETYGLSALNSVPKWKHNHGYPSNVNGTFTFPLENPNLSFDYVRFQLIDTDYDSFLISYVCAHDYVTKFISVGVYTRGNSISHSKFQDIIKLFAFYGIQLHLIPTNWKDCRARCI